MKTFFITGIGTEIGKTIVSSILTECLEADYWKPIQAGDLEYTDTDKVKNFISNTKTKFYPEQYRLNTPASPHYSAEIDKISIEMADFKVPITRNKLLIEGAGGLFVPLNNDELIIDLIQHLGFPVILVSRNYLGSINHTLLSIDALEKRNIPIACLIFNGKRTDSTESFIKNYSSIDNIYYVDELEELNKKNIQKEGTKMQEQGIEKILKH